MSKSRNFFKHADRDGGEKHQFSSEFNDFSLLESIIIYQKFKTKWAPETLLFFIWIGLAHPSIIEEDSDVSAALHNITSKNEVTPDNKAWFSWAVRMMREKRLELSNVTLEYGEQQSPGRLSSGDGNDADTQKRIFEQYRNGSLR